MGINFPNSPASGDTYAPVGGPTFQWNGTAWTSLPQGIPVSVYMSDTAPPQPAPGQLWWNSTTGNMSVWYADPDSAQWVQVSGQVAPLGSVRYDQAQTLTAAQKTQAQQNIGGWEVIATGAMPTGTGVKDFNNLGAYRTLRFSGKAGLIVAGAPGFQLSIDNGTAFVATSNYITQNLMNVGAAWQSQQASATAFYMNAFNNLAASTGGGTDGIVFIAHFFDFAAPTTYGYIHTDATYINTTGQICRALNTGIYNFSASPRNALRFLNNSGNWSGGYYILEGMRG